MDGDPNTFSMLSSSACCSINSQFLDRVKYQQLAQIRHQVGKFQPWEINQPDNHGLRFDALRHK